MSTNDIAVTAADYAAGLRALADFLEAKGLPASRRFSTQPFGIQLDVTSADAVKDFALTHDLPVIETRHTRTVLALGPTPNTYRDGSVELTVVYVPDEPKDEAPEEPEQATGVATYDCPEPDCTFNVSAVGTPDDPDEPDYYNEGIEDHARGHAEERARLAAPELLGLPQRTPLAAISPEFLDELDEPIPYLPVSPVTTALQFSHPAPAIAPIRDSGIDDVMTRVLSAALAFDELDDRREGLDVAGVDAWDTAREGLRQALADFREVTR